MPALTADEWLDGCDANPVMMNLLEGYGLPPSQDNQNKPEEKTESRNHVSPPKVEFLLLNKFPRVVCHMIISDQSS